MAGRKSSPRNRLQPSAIVIGAIALGDAEGLDAVTIRRLAQDHGVTPMALYWHFKDKEALLSAMAERLLAEVELPTEGYGLWDRRLRATLDAFLAGLRAHPMVAPLTLPRLFDSDAGLRIADQVIGLLRNGGFGPDDAAELASFLLSAVTTMLTPQPSLSLDPASPRNYPHVSAASQASADSPANLTHYRRGVELLVRGAKDVMNSQTP
jgi:AcrR family transcriptional regulator